MVILSRMSATITSMPLVEFDVKQDLILLEVAYDFASQMVPGLVQRRLVGVGNFILSL